MCFKHFYPTRFHYILCLLLFSGSFSGTVSAQVKPAAEVPLCIGTTVTLHSAVLNENRQLNIYYPQSYKPGDTARYPVIYLLDGSADEDFLHIAGILQFFEMMQMAPPTILVGIANVDRRRDFTHPTTVEEDRKKYPTTGSSASFIRFLEQELQPYVEKKLPGNGQRMIIGQSLGGLLAAEILLEKPRLFTQYLIVSPSTWWDRGSLLGRYEQELHLPEDYPLSVYIAVGREGEEMETGARRLQEHLKKAAYSPSAIRFGYFPDEDHATILHQAAYKGLLELNKEKRRR